MSTVLLRRQLAVAITGAEAGSEFAESAHDIQVDFFRGWMASVREWNLSWPSQCRRVVENLKDSERRELAELLQVLVDDLRTPRD